jgi:hypothetical protein
MSADIIEVDFKAKTRRDQQSLEQLAIEIINVALIGDPKDIGREFGLDTAPSEYCAPSDDSA